VNDAEFELLDRIEDDHWWFVGKRLLLRALADRHAPSGRLLDLGCGTGGVLRNLSGNRPCLGADRSRAGLLVCRKKGFDRLVCADLSRIPFAPGSFDTVMALDVIEHLDDEVGFLRAASELCSPDGVLIIAVPAFQWMWSQHDETFQHRRRYNARQLRSTLEGAGLEVERLTYTNLFPFPLVALWRLVSHRLGAGRLAPKHDFFRLPGPLNRLLIGLYALEAWLLGRFDLPFGVSVVGIARRAAPGAST
jgi:SAM-dependent methyltransferase